MEEGEINTKLQQIPIFVGEERVKLRNVRDNYYNFSPSRPQIRINNNILIVLCIVISINGIR